jgi:hypothetical protein
MKRDEIELDGIYEGQTGEQRKVIKSLFTSELKYEVVAGRVSRCGITNLVFKDTFAQWAKRRVN